MTIHTNASLLNALKTVITNLPDYAREITIRIKVEELPQMEVLGELCVDGQPIVIDGKIQTELKRFRIVPIEPTEEPTT